MLNVVRWIHIIAGVAWLGEVIAINFVLVPALLKMDKEFRGIFIRQVFPRVFHLASVLSLTAVVSGATMNYLMTGWQNFEAWMTTRWGLAIIGGGTLGLLLTLFHFFAEHRLEPLAIAAEASTALDVERIVKVLNVVPKIGMLILLAIILLMLYATRGL